MPQEYAMITLGNQIDDPSAPVSRGNPRNFVSHVSELATKLLVHPTAAHLTRALATDVYNCCLVPTQYCPKVQPRGFATLEQYPTELANSLPGSDFLRNGTLGIVPRIRRVFHPAGM